MTRKLITGPEGLKTEIKFAFCFFTFLISLLWGMSGLAQPAIAWQQTIGNDRQDEALKLIPDDAGHMILIGRELHQDFTGQFRYYLVAMKVTPEGEEVWKTYHDVAFNTFSIPVDYAIHQHFYTEEFGDTLLNLVVQIFDRKLLYKIHDRTGDYWSYEEIPTLTLDVDRENEKTYATTLCSVQQSCYGPDSLVVERFDPSPDSLIFDPVEWRYELKQNIRPQPAQGHIDFNVQDIRVDEEGNTWLLVQLQRWDFQFCTDCADAFIDAYNEVFKFDPEGQLLGHANLQTTTAVVSRMRLVGLHGDRVIIAVDDINAAGTKVISTMYRLRPDLSVEKKYSFDQAYAYMQSDDQYHIRVLSSIHDPQDPAVHGQTDVLMARFDANGERLWKTNFGGSDFDFPRGFIVHGENEITFVANTYSSDFDVATSLGQQDMWLVRTGEGTTAVDESPVSLPLHISPNPASELIRIKSDEMMIIRIMDMQGKMVRQGRLFPGDVVNVQELVPGTYALMAVSESGQRYAGKWIKM